MQTNKHIYSNQKQKGAVLVTALVLMAILTIIGITSMRENIMDVKIHKSMKSRTNAFQCAEAGLRAGEMWVDRLARVPETAEPPAKASYQFWPSTSTKLANMEVLDNTWWESNGWTYGTDLIDTDVQIGCSTEPYYIIEHIGYVDGGSKDIEFGSTDLIDYFRITARSAGINSAAAVVLQTTYGKRVR